MADFEAVEAQVPQASLGIHLNDERERELTLQGCQAEPPHPGIAVSTSTIP
jgi:hypothetical protein